MASQMKLPTVKNREGDVEEVKNESLYFYDAAGKHVGSLRTHVGPCGELQIHWDDQLLVNTYPKLEH